MGRPIVVAVLAKGSGGALVRQLDGLARNVAFGERAALRDLLDDVPIAVAGREVHPAVEPARIFPQLLLDGAHRLDKLAPVHRTQKAQAADGIADRDLFAGLFLRFHLDQLLDRLARLGKSLLDPREGQGERCAVSLQQARQLGDERTHHRRVRARHVGDHENETLRIVLGDLQHLVGPRRGPAPVDRAPRDPGADTAQVLDQRQPQHDGNGPQLAERQRRHRLVGGHETRQAFGVDPAVPVGDRLEREVVHTRQAGRRAVREPRQFAAVPLGQVPPGRANLLLDEVEVVEEPLGCRCDASVRRDRLGQQVADFDQDAIVLREPRQQPVRVARRQTVREREVPAVLLHLIGAEQLRPQRRLLADVFRVRTRAAEACSDREQSVEKRLLARVQFTNPRCR